MAACDVGAPRTDECAGARAAPRASSRRARSRVGDKRCEVGGAWRWLERERSARAPARRPPAAAVSSAERAQLVRDAVPRQAGRRARVGSERRRSLLTGLLLRNRSSSSAFGTMVRSFASGYATSRTSRLSVVRAAPRQPDALLNQCGPRRRAHERWARCAWPRATCCGRARLERFVEQQRATQELASRRPRRRPLQRVQEGRASASSGIFRVRGTKARQDPRRKNRDGNIPRDCAPSTTSPVALVEHERF